MPSHADLLEAARYAVADACAVCRAVQRGMEQVRHILKDDASPVTIADFASQAVVAKVLRERLGEIVLVGEETSTYLRNPEHAVHLEATLAAAQEVWPEATEAALLDAIDAGASDTHHAGFWTLDPIDGTKGFLRGQQYAVALAYIERGEPVVAALGCPNLPRDFSAPLDEPDPQGSLYIATRGEGAAELPADDPGADPVRLRRLTPRDNEPIAVCASVEAGHSSEEGLFRVLAEAGPTREPVRIDSQCKYAVVARGQADAYLRLPTKKGYVERIWDHAAGALIASECGCFVTDILGRQLDFSHGRGLEKNLGILCAPPAPHGRLLGAIQKLGLDKA